MSSLSRGEPVAGRIAFESDLLRFANTNTCYVLPIPADDYEYAPITIREKGSCVYVRVLDNATYIHTYIQKNVALITSGCVRIHMTFHATITSCINCFCFNFNFTETTSFLCEHLDLHAVHCEGFSLFVNNEKAKAALGNLIGSYSLRLWPQPYGRELGRICH
jgi:hypothetical protein